MIRRRLPLRLAPIALSAALLIINTGCSSDKADASVAPDPPTDIVATVTKTSVKVAFTAPVDDGGSEITGYTASCASPDIPLRGGQSATSPITVTGLASGHTYSCTVRAANDAGQSEPSEPSDAFTPEGVPTAPTAAGAVPYGSGIAKVTWRVPADDGGSPITGYVITPYKGKVAQPVRTFNSTATTQQLSGLPNGKAFTFAIAARNATGTSDLSTKAGVITIGAPGKPGNVKATKAGANSLRVAFTSPSNNGAAITSYTAACRATSGSNANSKTGTGEVITPSQRAITVPNLAAGRKYTCTAKAANSRGVGPLSTPSPQVAL